jgi:hypothetical protein
MIVGARHARLGGAVGEAGPCPYRIHRRHDDE